MQWIEQHGYELIDFKLDRGHTGPFMYDNMLDNMVDKTLYENKRPIYIINYKDRDGKVCSGYIMHGNSGLNLGGSNIIFEPIESTRD